MTLVTLTFDLVNPKSIGFLSLPRPISMHVKYESSVINSFQDNGLNHLVNRRTDGSTDLLTLVKQYAPSSLNIGDIGDLRK